MYTKIIFLVLAMISQLILEESLAFGWARELLGSSSLTHTLTPWSRQSLVSLSLPSSRVCCASSTTT